ncbi:MAG: CHAT domain-containing protein [Planctomycetes bacterium]|nr:CHAT domain-containing protein [Planctomycetota bacterium]
MANAAWQRVYDVRLATLPDDHPDLQTARVNLALTIKALGDLSGARALEEKVLEVRSRALPDDHPDLQAARENLAGTLYRLGDLSGARALEEKVLEVRSRTLPDDHPDLQAARGNLAVTIKALGDLAGARALQEKVLEVCSRTLSDDHPDLQWARGNLATTIKALGDLTGARTLEERVLEVRSRMLPDDHPDLLRTRLNLAGTLYRLGDLSGARALEEKVLEVRSRTLPDNHPDLQAARGNLAVTIKALGDLAGARALQEKVLEVCSRTLPDDHPDLQDARQSLAATISALGDLAGARALEEKVLEVRSRTLPDDHPDLQDARQNLAAEISALGDLAGARALEEKVLEVRSRTLPDDHPDLQDARQNLAATLYVLVDLAGARALDEKVLEVRSRTLPDDHPDLQDARQNLAATISALGDLAGARALEEKVLEVRSRTLPDDHPDLQWARTNLAVTLYVLGDLAGARALQEKVLAVCSRTLPDDHPDLQDARQRLAWTLGAQLARADRMPQRAREGSRATAAGRDRCTDLIGACCLAQVHAARAAILEGPGREAEERCSSLAQKLDASVSFAQGYGVFDPLRELESPSFVLAETTRGAALIAAQLTRGAATAPKYAELRDELRHASDALAGLALVGTTSVEFDRARTKREALERELVALARDLSGGKDGNVDLDVGSLAGRLAEREAAVSFRRYTKWQFEVTDQLDSTGRPAVRETSAASLCAFVVRSGSENAGAAHRELTLVDLGPIEPIEAAARRWRDTIGVGAERGLAASSGPDELRARGEELRRLVFDPLLAALGDASHVVVALDDVLHLVPLEALPLADSKELVGDRWRIETRATLTELLSTSPDPTGSALVAFGGASFNVTPLELSAQDVAEIEDEQPVQVASLLRGSAWERGFTPLTHTGDEARGIGALYTEIYEDERPALVLEKRKASREALVELAPKARFLHVATHGWFAPESIKSWSDPEPLDKLSGLGMRMSSEEQVRGMSPMLLCGLALAGANLPEDAVGRAPGLITADELSTLDLSNCELAVLSACDTNVGERRAGQGVASLQKALQMAGARSVITSLWKVPDEATKDLMLDFYRRLWVEKKPKWQALWEAKTKLRNAKGPDGKPLYTTRDWAAWVLTGVPD